MTHSGFGNAIYKENKNLPDLFKVEYTLPEPIDFYLLHCFQIFRSDDVSS